MPISSRATIKSMLGVPTGITRHDTVIDMLLEVADQIALNEVDLDSFSSTTYSEKIDIDIEGLSEISLSHSPVISVAALTVSTTLYTDDDYVVDKNLGIIKTGNLSSFFPVGREVIEITYNAGFSVIPSDITYACNLIGVSLFNQQSHVGYKSERTTSYSYTLESGKGSNIPDVAQKILSKYRRVFARGMFGV